MAVRRELNSGGLACALFFSQNVLPPTILYSFFLFRASTFYAVTPSSIHAHFNIILYHISNTWQDQQYMPRFLKDHHQNYLFCEKFALSLFTPLPTRQEVLEGSRGVLKPLEATFGRSMLSSHLLIKHISSTIMGYSATLGPPKKVFGMGNFLLT